jgi:hypothetical protein
MVGDPYGWQGAQPQGVVQAYFAGSGALAGTAIINPDKTYTVTGLAPGVYKLRTLCSNAFQDQWWTPWSWANPGLPVEIDPAGAGATTVDVTSSSATSKTFVLKGAHFISGRARDPQGNPISGEVWMYRGNSREKTEPILPDGTFLMRLPPEAGFKLIVVPNDGHISSWYGGVSATEDGNGATATLIDLSNASLSGIEMVIDAYASILGHVRDENGAEVAPCWVQVLKTDGTLARSGYGPSGFYSCAPLLPGSYRLRTLTNNLLDVWYGGLPVIEDPSGASATIVNLTGHDDLTVDFTLLIRRIISGTVFREDWEPAREGTVVAYDDSGKVAGKTKIMGDGTYLFYDLSPGIYKICTAETGIVDSWYKSSPVAGDPSGAGANPIDVTSAHQRDIDFWLPLR